MTSDFKPYLAFRAYAASALKVSPDELEGGSTTEESAKLGPYNIGNAWSYTMSPIGKPREEVRGWVTADGTVITLKQNVSRLFLEAGVWSKSFLISPVRLSQDPAAHKREARLVREALKRDYKLAQQLLWWYGDNYFVATEYLPSPMFELRPDRSGTFEFFAGYRLPGSDGAGGGPIDYFEIKVVLTADHRATLTMSPYHQQ